MWTLTSLRKNTTLGGLLTSKEVELDRDNKIVTDSANTIKVSEKFREGLEAGIYMAAEGATVVNMDSGNSGKGVILEKAKLIREALEMAKDYGYEPPVSIVADQFEYSNEPLDVASMYPPRQLTRRPE